ncbi:NAD(P)-binding protein [Rhizodiscina lignyota]|uniref:NAD(P)-binding protein n=1 Tax=Rhizodiscina lignyota TaxID=1504668 RepID=A0A9P4IHF2_9PEZI|nr:NAD(P)-binding protein [Rhizodiscina lignyota]
MAFPYKKILVIGATSGIGEALSARFVENGIFVIVTGRRKERLDSFVEKHGKDKAAAEVFDIAQLDKIPHFAREVTAAHPDIDAVLVNAGMQRGFDFSKPETVDLADVDMEVKTNYSAYLHITHAFLPFLQNASKSRDVALMYMSSGLALLPMIHIPGYCATKAALHHFILVLREQLKGPFPRLKIIEIFPPAVQTELHDWFPDLEVGRGWGMPLDQFTDIAWSKLSYGEEQPNIGLAEMAFNRFESARQAAFQQLAEKSRSEPGKDSSQPGSS